MKISEIKSGDTFVEAAKKLLATLADDEVLTLQEIAKKLGRNQPSNTRGYEALRPFSCKVNLGKTMFVYGNAKALRALRKKLAI